MRGLLLVVLVGCTATSSTQQLGIDPMTCSESLPAQTSGTIGDAYVTLAVSAATFSTSFANASITGTSQGTIDYPGQGQLTFVTSSDALDPACVGKTVYYSYAWSDDCTEVGLSRDRDDCELRIFNLDGSTLVQK